MKIKLIDRTLEINKYRININNFKNEKYLIGASFNRKEMKLKDYKRLLLFIIMPYKWLNKNFLEKKM